MTPQLIWWYTSSNQPICVFLEFFFKRTHCCHRNRAVAHWGGSEQPGHSLHHWWTVTLSTIWGRHQRQLWSRLLSSLESLWIRIHTRLGPNHLDRSSTLCGHRTSLSADMMVLISSIPFLVGLIRWMGREAGRCLCVWWCFGSGAQRCCNFKLHACRYTQTLAFQCWWALNFRVILTVLWDGADLFIYWIKQGLETKV